MPKRICKDIVSRHRIALYKTTFDRTAKPSHRNSKTYAFTTLYLISLDPCPISKTFLHFDEPIRTYTAYPRAQANAYHEHQNSLHSKARDAFPTQNTIYSPSSHNPILFSSIIAKDFDFIASLSLRLLPTPQCPTCASRRRGRGT